MVQYHRSEKRLAFDSELRNVLGTSNVYFQPPPTINMLYPCIRYNLADIDTKYANNGIYALMDGYDITIIDRNPDSQIPDNLMNAFKRCKFDRKYVADNLHHFVFRIYY